MLRVFAAAGMVGTITRDEQGRITCSPSWLTPVIAEAVAAMGQIPDAWDRLDGWSNGYVWISA